MDIAHFRIWTATLSLAVIALLAVPATRVEASVTLHGAVPTEYNYALAWSARNRSLSGRGSIRVRNESAAELRSVWLRLRPNYPTELERIKNVRGARINGQAAGKSMLRLRLDRPLGANQSARVFFDMELKVPTENTSLGRSAGVDLFGDALPVVAVAGQGGLRIGPEPSYGEASFNPVANWRVRLKVPNGLEPVLPGDAEWTDAHNHSNTWVATASVRDFAFAIGRFSTTHGRASGTSLTVYAPAALDRDLPSALRRVRNAFSKMQGWYGGYRLPDLKVVLGDLEFGGSEYPGLVFSTPDNATISHEVAHQWFYGLVGNDQYSDPFLDESLTAFSEQRFHKSYRCDLARPIRGEHGLSTGMSYWQKHPAAYEDTIYRGGACALTVLQRDLGAALFDRALRAYVAANADKIAGVNDFLSAIRTAAPWYDLARWQKLVGLQ